MGKNDPIDCFNKQECIYEKCSMYDRDVSICGIERLKSVQTARNVRPAQVNPLRSQTPGPTPLRTQTPTTPRVDNSSKSFTRNIDVVNGMKNFRVHGLLVGDPIQREVTVRGNPQTITEVMLDDRESTLRVTFWNQSKVPDLVGGDEITIDGLMGKDPYNGTPQASGGDYVKVTFEKV